MSLRLERIGVGGFGGVADHTAGAVQVRHDRHVGEVCGVGGVEPDVAVNSSVVEEVVPVALPFPGWGVFDDAWRDRLPIQRVVHDGGDPDLLAGGYMLGDVHLEWRVTTLMGNDLGLVHPHRGPVCRRLEMQHDPLTLPAARHPHRSLIPDVAEVITDGCVGRDVVEAGRHRHLPRLAAGAPRTSAPSGPLLLDQGRSARAH